MKDKLIHALFNETESRLRAGWRILLFLVVVAAISFALQSAVKLLFGGFAEDRTLRMLGMVGMAATAGTIGTVLARRFLDRRSLVSFGLRLDAWAVKDWLFGYVLSAAMAATVFLVQYWSGLMTFEGVNPAVGTAPFIVDFLIMFVTYCVLVAWWEELVFRGYLFQNMVDGMGKMPAIVISCVLYGLIHAANPNAGLLSSTIIVLFGYLRLYGYLSTSQLWLSMGMHAAWNFFQGPVFGYAASGYETRTILVHSPNGPDWLTGGKFGPEGSVITIPVVLLALVAMWWWSRGRVGANDAYGSDVDVAGSTTSSHSK